MRIGVITSRDKDSHRQVRLLAVALLMALLSLAYQTGPWQAKAEGTAGEAGSSVFQEMAPYLAEETANKHTEPVIPESPKVVATPTPDQLARAPHRAITPMAEMEQAATGEAPASASAPVPPLSALPASSPLYEGEKEQTKPAALTLPPAPASPNLPASALSARPGPQPTPQAMVPTLLLLPLEAEMLMATNKERAKVGLGELLLDSGLVEVARARSRDMAQRNYFSHQEPGGRLAFIDLLEGWSISYSRAGENLARNNVAEAVSVATAIEGFMKSGPHRSNILSAAYQKIGIGVSITGEGMKYITLIFLAS